MPVMNKTFILLGINQIDDLPAMERWFVHHHCPECVTRENGEKWFLDVHALQVCKLPGLMRVFSYKAYDRFYSPIPLAEDVPDFIDFE